MTNMLLCFFLPSFSPVAFADTDSRTVVECAAMSCENDADFLVFDQTGCRAAVFGPLLLNPEGYTYAWNFGVPDSDRFGRVQNYEYVTDGSYDITLTLTAPDGTVTTCTQSFFVDCNDPCDDLTDFSFTNDGADCYKYTFTPLPLPDGVSMADLGDIWWHRWFIDGVLQTDANGEPLDVEELCYTFENDGEYEVTHWMEFDGVTFFNCSQIITVDCNDEPCATADFTASSEIICMGGLAFTALADCQIEEYSHEWEASVGGTVIATSTEMNFSEILVNFSTYQNPVLTVTHTLTDPTGTQVGSTVVVNYDFSTDGVEGIFIGQLAGVDNEPTLENVGDLAAAGLFDFVSAEDGLTWQSRDIFIYGILEVDEPTAFVSCDVTLGEKAGINVTEEFKNRLTVKKQTLLHGTCECLWRSIRLASGTELIGDAARFEDALYAIEPALENPRRPRIDLNKVQFSNNFVGIKSADFEDNGIIYTDNQFQQGRWKQVSFSNTRELYDICGLINDNTISDLESGTYAFSPDNGLAGIFLSELTIQELGGASVSFFNLANGIIIDNSTVRFTGLNFQNILHEVDYGEESGTGVRFLDAEGAHSIDYSNGNFINCRAGISLSTAALGTQAFITGMNMNNVAVGVSANDSNENGGGGQFAKVEITDCDIESVDNNIFPLNGINQGIGIYTPNTSSSSSFYIANNNIDVTQNPAAPGGPAGGAAGIIFEGNPLAANTLRCEMNTITMGDAVAGIQMQNWRGAMNVTQKNSVIFDNDIFLGNNADFHQGIRITNSNNNHFICNDVLGVNSGFGNGITMSASPNIELAGNTVENVEVGLTVNETCNLADIRFNTFTGQAFRGIEYTPDGVSGTQFDRGNIWNLTGANFDAFHNSDSEISIELSEYRVEVNGIDWGTNCGVSPQSCPWFLEDGQIPLMPTCEQMLTDNFDPQGFNGEDNGKNEEVAQGTGNAFLDWHLQRDLYEKMENSDYTENAMLNNFQTSNAVSKIGDFYSAESFVKNVYAVDATTAAAVEVLSLDRTDLLTELDSLDNLIDETYPEVSDMLYSERSDKQDAVQQNLSELHTVYAEIRNGQVENISDAVNSIVALPADDTFTANEKALLMYFTDMTNRGHALPTSVQLASIKEIAEMCVNEGGEVVYWARGWYTALTQKDDLNLTEDCRKESRERTDKQTEVLTNTKFNVFPNPADTYLNISFSQHEEGAENIIELFDFTGKKVKSVTVLNNERPVIRTDDLPNGLYRVIYKVNGNLTDSASVVVLH